MKGAVLAIFRKEIREMLRDRRVTTSAIFGPVFLVFFFVMIFGVIDKAVKEPKKIKVHYVKPENNIAFLDGLKRSSLELIEVKDRQTGEQMVKDGKAKVVLDFEPGFDAKFATQGEASVKAVFDDKTATSQIALAQISKIFGALGKAKLETTLAEKGLSKGLVEPIKIIEEPIKRAEEGVSSPLLSLLPYLIVIWAFYGGFSVASDLVAGEKERTTLETLLITPVQRKQIVLGKFFALSSVCFTSSMTTICALLLIGFLNLPATRIMFPHGLSISPLALLSMIGVLIPLVLLFAGILIAISAFARNSREAQTYLTLASFIVIIPAVFSQFIGFTEFGNSTWIGAVPVLNASVCMRDALMGGLDPARVGLTIGTSVILALIGMRVAIKLFEREQVLARI